MKVCANKIRRLMDMRLMTQAELAKLSGVSRTTVNYTLSRETCAQQTAGKLAKALSVNVADILEEV